MDILKELRLRRWARENYVSIEERQPKWHPIVLEEMSRKDEELLAAITEDEEIRASAEPYPMRAWDGGDPGSKIVPLMPTAHRLDAPHLGPAMPNLLSRPNVETVSGDADWGFYLG